MEKSVRVLVLACACLAVIFPAGVLAQEETKEEEAVLTAGVEADFNSRYLWRGLAYSEYPVLQPSAWISAYNFTLLGWGNMPLGDEDYQGRFNEADIYFSYYLEAGDFTLEPTYQHYFYPDVPDSPDTGEISVLLSYALDSYYLYTTHTVDVVEYSGAYFGDLGAGWCDEVAEGLELDGSLFAGFGSPRFNETYVGIDKGAFNTVGAALALNVTASELLYFRPHFEFYYLVDNDLREAVDDPLVWNFGLAVGAEF